MQATVGSAWLWLVEAHSTREAGKMITLYGFPGSRSTRVLWTLEELGEPYQYLVVDLRRGRVGDRSLKELNLGGKVPVLQDGTFLLTESLAICLYLAERDPQRRLLADGDLTSRARLLQWCSFAVSELEQPLWTAAKHRFVLPKPLRVPAVGETARHEFAQASTVLEAGLGGGPFILGDRFTVADVLIGHTLGWAQAAGWPVESESLEAYLDRVQKRPAYARAKNREEP